MKISDSPSVWQSDIVHACREEMAITVADVMRRRTRLALSPHGGEPTARLVSQLMAAELAWNEATRQRHLQYYLAEWQRNHGWLADRL
jgi:glycerol-3-phosphate dehydrogenase